jgi:leucyl aminopeptidase
VLVFEGRKEARFGAGDLMDAGEVAGKSLELTLLHRPPGVAATRVLLAGAGKLEKFDCAELRRVAGAAVRHLKSKSVKTIALALDPEHADGEYAAAAVEGAILGEFEPDRYKTDDDKKPVETFAVAAAGGAANGLRIPVGMRSSGARADGEARHGRAAGGGAGQRGASGAHRDPLPAGAAMMGAMRAIAQLKPAIPLSRVLLCHPARPSWTADRQWPGRGGASDLSGRSTVQGASRHSVRPPSGILL